MQTGKGEKAEWLEKRRATQCGKMKDENVTHVASRRSHLLCKLDGEHVADFAHFAVEREAFNVNVGRAQDLAGGRLIDAAALKPCCKGECRGN